MLTKVILRFYGRVPENKLLFIYGNLLSVRKLCFKMQVQIDTLVFIVDKHLLIVKSKVKLNIFIRFALRVIEYIININQRNLRAGGEDLKSNKRAESFARGECYVKIRGLLYTN